VVLLPASPLRAAVKVAERIRTLVEVAAADKALYEAKRRPKFSSLWLACASTGDAESRCPVYIGMRAFCEVVSR
jgi:hypothetical protein